MREPDFASAVAICTMIHCANPNQASEMAAIVTALGSDNTTHDQTIEARAAILTPGSYFTVAGQTRFQADLLLLINEAKSGNLTNSQIISGLDDALGVVHAPGLIDIPYASANASPPIVGTIVTVTNGNWTGMPTYTYQWKRDGATNLGTSASYTLITADITGGHRITCVVTATNAQGSTAAPPSNAIQT